MSGYARLLNEYTRWLYEKKSTDDWMETQEDRRHMWHHGSGKFSMCVRILAGKELHKYVIRKIKCVTIPFSTKTTFPPGCSGGI